ncbi:MAG TPA: type II toxin-antitoxin system VapC family toxin [Anaerolineales bacterium]|nr:type II toxin-antitoxin system VapC family toxin [Anaerolineales bacterium]
MAELPSFVLDTCAILAYLQDEQAATRVEELLNDARLEKCRLFVSIMNLGELLYITERRGGVTKAQDVLALIQQLPIEVLPPDQQAVFAAAHIKANHAVSFADSFAVAAATEKKAAILTDDPEFKSVEEIVTVEWLGQRQSVFSRWPGNDESDHIHLTQ